MKKLFIYLSLLLMSEMSAYVPRVGAARVAYIATWRLTHNPAVERQIAQIRRPQPSADSDVRSIEQAIRRQRALAYQRNLHREHRRANANWFQWLFGWY